MNTYLVPCILCSIWKIEYLLCSKVVQDASKYNAMLQPKVSERHENERAQFRSVDKKRMQLPNITAPTTVKTTWVFQPLCTRAARRLYFMTVRV